MPAPIPENDPAAAYPSVAVLASRLMEGIHEDASAFLEGTFGAYPHTLYHYTKGDVPASIAQNAELWGSHFCEMNDAREVGHLSHLMRETLQSEIALCNPIVDGNIKCESLDDAFRIAVKHAFVEPLQAPGLGHPYIVSFSALDDDMQQWRSYGDGGRGACLHFDTEALIRDTDNRRGVRSGRVQVVPVIYEHEKAVALGNIIVDKTREALRAEFERIGNPDDPLATTLIAACSAMISGAFQYYGPLCKHRSFRSEQEWRIVIPGPEDPSAGLTVGSSGVRFVGRPAPSSERRRAKMGISRATVMAYQAGPCADDHTPGVHRGHSGGRESPGAALRRPLPRALIPGRPGLTPFA